MKKIDYIRKLLEEKEKTITTDLDKEKIENLKFILKEDDAFFKLDLETSLGILSYLGIKEDKLKELYFELVSPNEFMNNKQYVTLSNRG